MEKLTVKGRVLVEFNIRAVTGLHIGGAGAGIQIGGIEKEVIRDPLTNRPYIPGSSLKGKIRSLLEKQLGLKINRQIGQTKIHSCDSSEEYKNCRVCWVFGVPGEVEFNTPTRLIVRDVPLSEESAQEMERLPLDRPFAEVKTEVSIDRITSAANPRTIERVPAGVVFGPGEMVYTVYSSDDGVCKVEKDVNFLATVFQGMKLLEQDYLGGLGSRGSGTVKFEKIRVFLSKDARTPEDPLKTYSTLDELLGDLAPLLDQIRKELEGG